jgi:branched-chain amino acid aminotransferase
MVEKVEKIWFDGKLVDWDKATVHVLTHTLHYGLGVFEGIRFYKTADGKPAIFRLKEHIDRFFESALVAKIEIPFGRKDIISACTETTRLSGLETGYIRPLSFIGYGAMGLYVENNPISTIVAVWPWGAYLGEEGMKNGIRAKVSSFIRHHVSAGMTKAKICGQYTNSILAKKEAKECGYDEAILMDTEGYISEASGENIFIVKNGKIKTTSLTSILSGITRDTIIQIARDKNYILTEQKFTRDEMYTADEVFLTGTAAEVTPIREIDHRKIGPGKPGAVTMDLQKTYFDTVTGKVEKYRKWLTYIEK